MLFEGSEKKAEVHIDDAQLSLLDDFDDAFWATLVAHSRAKILSKIENDSCKAFLLSESSLFVWQDHFQILTCGETQTVNSVQFFIEHVGKDKIKHVCYQRKNEYFSHSQPSSFGDDIKRLQQLIPGKAYRFGELDSHHTFIFHQDNDYFVNKEDKTYEFLAYEISEQASQLLTTQGLSKSAIRKFLHLDALLPECTIDDYVFDPYGYSLNAIVQDKYLTIHITPQSGSSYVSFESNINLISHASRLIDILEPASVDVLSFNDGDFKAQLKHCIPQNYVNKSLVEHTLSNGNYICFVNIIRPATQFSAPAVIEITQTNNAL